MKITFTIEDVEGRGVLVKSDPDYEKFIFLANDSRSPTDAEAYAMLIWDTINQASDSGMKV